MICAVDVLCLLLSFIAVKYGERRPRARKRLSVEFGILQQAVIPAVPKRRAKARVEPDRCAAELRDIRQLFNYAGNIADPIGVGIIKARRVDLIEYGGIQPIAGHIFSPSAVVAALVSAADPAIEPCRLETHCKRSIPQPRTKSIWLFL